MNKGQYRRLIVAVIAVIILLIVAVGMLVSIINRGKDIEIHNYIGKDGQSIIGPQGVAGIQGEPGKSIVGPAGKDGTNAQTIINNIVKEVAVKGDQGAPGLQLKVRVEPVSCLLQTQYEGDDDWQNIAQLPKPCEVGNDN